MVALCSLQYDDLVYDNDAHCTCEETSRVESMELREKERQRGTQNTNYV